MSIARVSIRRDSFSIGKLAGIASLALLPILDPLAPGVHAAEAKSAPVSLRSLLDEMTDRNALARFPQPAYRLIEFSSYDRNSKTLDDPEGWFANVDNAQFIRVEENNGRREWVIVDHQAPGAIVWLWMPDRRISPHGGGAKDETTLRIYFDRAETPAVEGHAMDLFNGKGLAPPPLAHRSLSSAVSFLPIPYARSCKVTLDAAPFYYNFACREYPAGTPIRTFSMAELNEAKPQLERCRMELLQPGRPAQQIIRCAEKEVRWQATLAKDEQQTIELPAGPAAVQSLGLALTKPTPQATRSLVLAIEFDGQQTVWSPVGEFFGTGVGIHPFKDWYRTVAPGERGLLRCRWIMPYQKSAKITLHNYDSQSVEVSLVAQVEDWKWDNRSMYFHANWRRQFPVKTRPFSDWNYLTIQGRGVYVGDTLTVFNPVPRWWGEGDAKIWVDGEKFPSMFATGTEDYYGYSWGGRNTGFYEHPFHAQVRVGAMDKLRPAANPPQVGTLGYSTQTRTRALDAIPCQRSLQVDMEVWHFIECDMDYAACTYWYGFADTKCNRGPEPKEAAQPIREPTPAHSP